MQRNKTAAGTLSIVIARGAQDTKDVLISAPVEVYASLRKSGIRLEIVMSE